MIQLCDNLANKNGFVTIEERAAELIKRKGERFIILNNAKETSNIKKYFDKKIGCDVYDLFKNL